MPRDRTLWSSSSSSSFICVGLGSDKPDTDRETERQREREREGNERLSLCGSARACVKKLKKKGERREEDTNQRVCGTKKFR
jgi:hypothetical protein